MQAVIRAGNKQYLVTSGQTLEIDLVGAGAAKLEFIPLLIIDGNKTLVGTPEVAGHKVRAEVVGEVKGDKLQVLKFKPKKRVNKRTGHRQRYTQIKITKIEASKPKPVAALASATQPAAKPKAKALAGTAA